jgi:hypothetical protein
MVSFLVYTKESQIATGYKTFKVSGITDKNLEGLICTTKPSRFQALTAKTLKV